VKLGFMFIGLPEPEKIGERLRRHGLSAVEIAMPLAPSPLPPRFVECALACSRDLAVPVAFHEALTLALATRDADTAGRIRDRIRQSLDLALRCRASVLTLHTTSPRTIRSMLSGWKEPSTRWLAHEMDCNVTPDLEEARHVLVELLRELGPWAASGGLTIALENNFRDTRYFGPRIDSIRHVLDVLEQAASPGLGVCFDVYKAVSTEQSVPEAIRGCGRLIANVHLSDFEPTDTTIGRLRCAIGSGAIDWAAVLRALREAGYDGPMILEMMGSGQDLETSRTYLEAVQARLSADALHTPETR